MNLRRSQQRSIIGSTLAQGALPECQSLQHNRDLCSQEQSLYKTQGLNHQKKLVNNSEIMKWLKKRHQKAAKIEYIKSKLEVQREEEMEGVFHKFDIDKSGTIELNELFQMFKAHRIQVSKRELRKLFLLADTDGNGALSLDEFKEISSNPQASKAFRKMIERLRGQEEHQRSNPFSNSYLPFNFNRLLDHLSHMTKRDSIINKIERNKFSHEHTQANIKNFIQLFILDEGAKDSLVKENTAKIIENAILGLNNQSQKHNIAKERLTPKKYGLKRLDTQFLDQLTQDALNRIRTLQRQRTIYQKQQKDQLAEISENNSFMSDDDCPEMEDDQVTNHQYTRKASILSEPGDSELMGDDARKTIAKIIQDARIKGKSLAKEEFTSTSSTGRNSVDIKKLKAQLNDTCQHKLNKQQEYFSRQRHEASAKTTLGSFTNSTSTRLDTNATKDFQKCRIKMPLASGKVSLKDCSSLQEQVKENQPELQQRLYVPKRLDGAKHKQNKTETFRSVPFKPVQLNNKLDVLQKMQKLPNEHIQVPSKLPGLMRFKQNKYNSLTDKANVMKKLLSSVAQEQYIKEM